MSDSLGMSEASAGAEAEAAATTAPAAGCSSETGVMPAGGATATGSAGGGAAPGGPAETRAHTHTLSQTSAKEAQPSHNGNRRAQQYYIGNELQRWQESSYFHLVKATNTKSDSSVGIICQVRNVYSN